MLSGLCAKSRQARLEWKRAGCPSEGPFHSEGNRLRNAVRERIWWCAAKAGSLRTQRRERESLPSRTERGSRHQAEARHKLLIDSEVGQDKSGLLEIWENHFQKLAESRLGSDQEWEEKIKAMAEDSFGSTSWTFLSLLRKRPMLFRDSREEKLQELMAYWQNI